MLTIFKAILRIIGYVLLTILLIAAIEYALCPIYNFPLPSPFQGNLWYNPYKNSGDHWQQANFHAHTRTWFNVTDGKDTPEELTNHYKNMGYSIIAISNYQRISSYNSHQKSYIPAYEHGFNSYKTHQLPIGADQVLWLDYLFWQNSHHKQHILDQLGKSAAFISLAHPLWHDAYTPDDMTNLTGFNSFELNRHKNQKYNLWDEALSRGKVIWMIGNDDTHDINNSRITGVIWTMINSASTDKEHVISAMKAGRMYSVRGKNGVNQNKLDSVIVRQDTIKIYCQHEADEIRLIGQDGKVKKITENKSCIEYALQPDDTYIRTEITSKKFKMYLNPVVRYDGKQLPQYKAEVNTTATWIQRIIILAALGSAFIRWILIHVPKKEK